MNKDVDKVMQRFEKEIAQLELNKAAEVLGTNKRTGLHGAQARKLDRDDFHAIIKNSKAAVQRMILHHTEKR